MAYTKVTDLMTSICDAIREKEGSTGLIPHQELPERIRAIPGGTVIDELKYQIVTVSTGGFDASIRVDNLINGVSKVIPYTEVDNNGTHIDFGDFRISYEGSGGWSITCTTDTLVVGSSTLHNGEKLNWLYNASVKYDVTVRTVTGKNIGNLKDGLNVPFVFGFNSESWGQYFEPSSAMSFEFSNDSIVSKWNGGSSIGGLIIANSKIDVSYLNTITMKANATACYSASHGGNFPFLIAINPTKNTSTSVQSQNYAKKSEVTDGTIGDIELVIDVSDLTGKYYIHISPVGYSCTITDLILE